MDDVRIRYVGRKPYAFDNVTRSGTVWMGHGDVQPVTPNQAQALLRFPDQWALEDSTDAERIPQIEEVVIRDSRGEAVAVAKDRLKKPIEHMTKVEMMALAQEQWGKVLPMRLSSKQMQDQIEEWLKDGV